jgi:hypothetical protein
MKKFAFLAIAASLALSAAPASAQAVITNPGWCAQFYPNANCQNLGPGNPYTSYGWATGSVPQLGYGPYHHYRHRHYWRRY